MMRAYYNEIDRDAAHALRALIADGVIAPGNVDERSIKDVQPDDIRRYTQCHFFAGGGLWSVAARLAGWPDDRPLWTGSCPCQPFSVAGKGAGADDPRHLWPDFFRLIRACRPPVVMGEQVAGAAGRGWFDGVSADLEGGNYACRAVDVPACAVDAPHIRQRLYWLADANVAGSSEEWEQRSGQFLRSGGDQEARAGDDALANATGVGRREGRAGDAVSKRTGFAASGAGICHGSAGMADPDESLGRWRPDEPVGRAEGRDADRDVGASAMVDADRAGQQQHCGAVAIRPELSSLKRASGSSLDVADTARDNERWQRQFSESDRSGIGLPDRGHSLRNGSFWSDHEWRTGADGKARRVKPDLRLLVDGLPGRVGLLRIGGNAISPVLAAEVIGAYLDCERAAT